MSFRFSSEDMRDQESRQRLAKEHALAIYGWSNALLEFRQQGVWQSLVGAVVLFVARPIAILCWENIFGTLVATSVFLYTWAFYDQIGNAPAVLLVSVGTFFLTPFFALIGVDVSMAFTDISNMNDDEIAMLFYSWGGDYGRYP